MRISWKFVAITCTALLCVSAVVVALILRPLPFQPERYRYERLAVQSGEFPFMQLWKIDTETDVAKRIVLPLNLKPGATEKAEEAHNK